MADEDKRAAEDKARKDAEEIEKKADAEKLDKLLTGIDAVCAKMDSFEERLGKIEGSKKDAEKEEEEEKKDDAEEEDDKPVPVAADKKRKDADEKEEKEEEKKDDDDDKSRKDSQLTTALADIASLKAQIKPISDADRRAFAGAQEKADAAFSAFGDSAPPPMAGESLLDYRLRLLGKLQDHSPVWKGRELGRIARADATLVDVAEQQIYADAVRAADQPADLKPGEMREVVRRDAAGRPVSTFKGKTSFVRQFTVPGRRVANFARPSRGNR